MLSTRIVEAIDIFKDCHFGLSSCLPALPPDQLDLDCFEECLHRRIVIAITLAAHGWPEVMLPQDLLIIM